MSSGWVKIIKLSELSHPFLIFHDWRKRQCLLIGRTLLWICVLSYHHVHMLPQPSFSMVMWSLLWSSILWDFFTLPHPSSKGVECTYQGMLSLVRSFLLHSNAFLSYLNTISTYYWTLIISYYISTFLGGLFPVHKPSPDKDKDCSNKVYTRGIQRLEAMLYAVDEINKDPTLLR